MADEAVVSLGAGGGAPSGGGDGGGSGAGSGGGSGDGGGAGAPAAPQTDEQILGIDPIGTPIKDDEPVPQTEQEKLAAAAAAKPADPNAVKTPEQIAAEATAAAQDDKTIPAKWQTLAKSDPEFRALYFTAKTNADKLATIEPQLQTAQTTLAAVEKMDQSFLSGDPVAIQGELKTFLADKPDALEPMLTAGLNQLKEANPQAYQSQLEKLTQETLKGWQFDKAFEVLRSAIDSKDTALLSQQVEKILEFVDGNGFPTTEKAKLDARAKELDTRAAQEQSKDEASFVKSSHTFRDTVQTKIADTVQGEIKTSIAKLLEKSVFTDSAKGRIQADAYAELNKMLAGNKDIIEQVGKAIWPNGSKDANGKPVRGIFNDANRELAINLPVNYAKSVLNDVVKKVVEQYTTDFMAKQQTTDKRMAAAAGKVEVSGGSPSPQGKKPLSKKDIDYGKMSDNDILDA